ncbi:unnamed protein product [Meloidogyne enterolobii]|uniref:Uncharacterized protein n=1 Tax=Meloidogyne enterolobii TaxID=390850 RepID=A0ACB0YEJ4_MELEN
MHLCKEIEKKVLNILLKIKPKYLNKMPKQEFDAIDMMGPVVAALIFAVVVFLISFTIINWYCITKKDDLTVFEKMGAKINVRLGPHTMMQIKRGGYVSTYAREEEEQHRKMTLSIDKQQAERLLKNNENNMADGEAIKH